MKTKRYYDVCVVGGGPVGLAVSTLLQRYGIRHCLIERRAQPTEHPQAHFLNNRTMEILQSYMPEVHQEVVRLMPPHHNWRDFVYCHSMLGNHFCRVDHMEGSKSGTNPLFWSQSPTSVAHLAQNKFEHILRDHHKKLLEWCVEGCDTFFGYQCSHVKAMPAKVTVTISPAHNTINRKSVLSNKTKEDDVEIECKYLLAADGANSYVRNLLGIAMSGQKDPLQTLLNVHFTCSGLRDLLSSNSSRTVSTSASTSTNDVDKQRPAMLYFTFNEKVVAVFVAHDPLRDEWVCQIPYFPPYQSPEDYSHQKIIEVLTSAIGFSKSGSLPIQILSVKSWAMHAQVAEHYSNSYKNIYLLGDAAHRFPPAGGFGMNTGIQDAHNLAWKIAMTINMKSDKNLLDSYEAERKLIAQRNTELSLQNYKKTEATARAIGLDPKMAKLAVDSAMSSGRLGVPHAIQKTAVLSALSVGLNAMSVMKTQNIVSRALIGNMQKLVAEGRSLQLIFPREDIGYTYDIYNSTRGSIDSMESINFSNPDNGEVRLTVGAMIPHCWMRISDHSTENSIPVEMFDQKQQSFKDIVSTLQLPAITEVLLQNAEFACTPKFLLVVLDSSISQWSSVIQQSIHCNILRDCLQLVSVRSQAVITHDVLQKALQTPNYQHPSEAFDRKLLKLKKPQKNSLEYLVVEDCTGRWLEKCEQFNISRSACRKQVSSCSVSVLVRPDGHVSEVHVEDREKSVDITREERIDFLLKFIEQTLYALE